MRSGKLHPDRLWTKGPQSGPLRIKGKPGNRTLSWDRFILDLRKTTKEFIENVLENIIESIVITDMDGHLVFFNKFSEEMFGYQAQEVLNRHIAILGAKEPDVLNTIRRNETFNGEITLKTKEGRQFPARVRCVPLCDEHDQPIAMVGVAWDLTQESEIQRLKEDLFQSEKMSLIGTLASEVAHEINNPLGGLIVAVQMLIKDLQAGQIDSQIFLEELFEIEKDAQRCRRITHNLLDFARRVPEERTLLNLNKVIEDALLLVQRQAELDNISFTKSYADDLPLLKGNANSLQQVLINLIKNSRDAMPEGGRIHLSTSKDRRDHDWWVHLSVEDTGYGISTQIMNRVFDPFFTTKAGGKGTGLGLAVSNRIVEEHGGHITFDNRPEGGVVFHVVLPAAKEKKKGKLG